MFSISSVSGYCQGPYVDNGHYLGAIRTYPPYLTKPGQIASGLKCQIEMTLQAIRHVSVFTTYRFLRDSVFFDEVLD